MAKEKLEASKRILEAAQEKYRDIITQHALLKEKIEQYQRDLALDLNFDYDNEDAASEANQNDVDQLAELEAEMKSASDTLFAAKTGFDLAKCDLDEEAIENDTFDVGALGYAANDDADRVMRAQDKMDAATATGDQEAIDASAEELRLTLRDLDRDLAAENEAIAQKVADEEQLAKDRAAIGAELSDSSDEETVVNNDEVDENSQGYNDAVASVASVTISDPQSPNSENNETYTEFCANNDEWTATAFEAQPSDALAAEGSTTDEDPCINENTANVDGGDQLGQSALIGASNSDPKDSGEFFIS